MVGTDKKNKQTDVGMIPTEWEIKFLKDLVDPERKIRYGIVQPGKFDYSGRYMVRGQDYSFGWVDEKELFRVSPQIEEPFKNARIEAGDIILTIVGAGTGNVEVVPDWLDGANITQTTARIRIIPEKAISLFCKFLLQSDIGKNQVNNYVKGGAQPGLNICDLELFKIPLPPTFAEQTAIATALSDADALITSIEKLIVKKRKIKQGVMHELLTGKKRLSGFYGNWRGTKLSEIFTISAGGDLQKNNFSTLRDDKYCFPIYSNALTDKGLYGYTTTYTSNENTITVTARGQVGVANYRDHKYSAIGRVIILDPRTEVNCFFISEYINQLIDFANESTGVPQLTAPQISKYGIRIPEFDEQTAIAQVLSDMDAEIESLEQKLSKYKLIKQGMMQELLTGKNKTRMTDIIWNGTTYRVSGQLTQFQKDLYIHLIDWKWKYATKEPGIYLRKGKDYLFDAILPEEYYQSSIWPHVYPKIEQRLREHQSHSDFGFKLHKHFYHMASSQAANANLFLPILEHPLAGQVLTFINPDIKTIARQELDNGYKLEYWGGAQPGDIGNNQGLLKDHNEKSGTDADIAIAYYNYDDELCLWLIEHKLTEREFTECGGAKSDNRIKHTDCQCNQSFSTILHNKNKCYYHHKKGFAYWDLTDVHSAFFPGQTIYHECPFQGGMNQLWRNQLLGLEIEANSKFPYKHVSFSVVRHPANNALLPSIAEYEELIENNAKFSTFTSQDVLSSAEKMNDPTMNEWIDWYKELYMI